MAWPAKASFISNKSISSIVNPSFFNNKGIATEGPIPIISGGTPTETYLTIFPKILFLFILYFLIIDFDTNKQRAAPSDKGLELPAVTEPFLTKHGFNLDKDSNDMFSLIQSSLLYPFILIISFFNFDLALDAFRWLLYEKISCSSLDILYF